MLYNNQWAAWLLLLLAGVEEYRKVTIGQYCYPFSQEMKTITAGQRGYHFYQEVKTNNV